VAERELGCPDETYQHLQRLRNHLISAKILYDRFTREAEEHRKEGRREEALDVQALANSMVKVVREIEDKIAELGKLCFGKEKKSCKLVIFICVAYVIAVGYYGYHGGYD